ncbi:hypothetical protein Bxe_B0375 [Paraburkholderia xenovorans LB400]|uniref:Uncharacterized protein n=1 Tax=Paraburkholderia xenovorans (strain LB400) TaxID=266265 RepID=Q13K18_PARXL|nr:hypothetical protein Bxe_B0375 [Paraburkholderia xenovorans LB400]
MDWFLPESGTITRPRISDGDAATCSKPACGSTPQARQIDVSRSTIGPLFQPTTCRQKATICALSGMAPTLRLQAFLLLMGAWPFAA